MFSTHTSEYPLADQQVRYALSVRIAIVIAAFFGVAWSLLQWTLTTEQRFMLESVTRNFVQLEAAACAAAALLALLYAAVRGTGWLIVSIRLRRLQHGTAQRIAAQRLGAYIRFHTSSLSCSDFRPTLTVGTPRLFSSSLLLALPHMLAVVSRKSVVILHKQVRHRIPQRTRARVEERPQKTSQKMRRKQPA